MKKIIALIIITGLWSCKSEKVNIQNVATFKGQQVTGVTVSNKGRIFANFPRWRDGVDNAVVEVLTKGNSNAFPNENWNSWKLGATLSDSVFVAVQAVVAFENKLYVLDTRNPSFKGVLDNPRIFAFDLTTNQLVETYLLDTKSFHQDSYINDLRVDKKLGKIYMTDSGHAGIVILDINSGVSFRVLDNHYATLAETDHLTFSNSVWTNTVHSDGIALDTKNDLLYFHALTGYKLYSIPTKILNSGNQKEIEDNVKLVATTSAPDGMILNNDDLFFADLENHKIMKLNIPTGNTSVIIEGEKVRWADTFSIHNNELFYTNSRINEVTGDIKDMEFTINKIKIK
ncbi:major royal jelly family protein [Flavobacterium algicola]|uniref:major royal jelly family protein n=1 Tax=Flavobacterium algicola TaxID=556529 RepID=UPI001EFE8DF7|nr:major royal jelly family protein [Flavobacterium algicola]MCG9792658.1 major royal jelly family protein [Flavobacterium algicola]